MVITHNLGFPRIGANRELKFGLERYWKGESSLADLNTLASGLRLRHWKLQSGLDLIPVGDFAFYDHVLEMSFILGNVPPRFLPFAGDPLDQYFRVARGRSASGEGLAASEMTKWFDTNYHYIVPEFTSATTFTLDPARLLAQVRESRAAGVAHPKVVLVGPLTYLALGKSRDGVDKLSLLDPLLAAYRQLLELLSRHGVEWVQLDEPILVTDLPPHWHAAFGSAWRALAGAGPRLLLATYFGHLRDNLALACGLPIDGLHLDVTTGRQEVEPALALLPSSCVLSLGVISGRNIWRSDLHATLDWLEPLASRLGDRLWIAPSCSLLHVPVTTSLEDRMDPDLRSWLAFAMEKLEEVRVLGAALNQGRAAVESALAANLAAVSSRRTSTRVHDPVVQAAVAAIDAGMGDRQSAYEQRATLQRERLRLPVFPTTTIGSFPQTNEIRQARSLFKAGKLSAADYELAMQAEIRHCVAQQESLNLDVLVHGEAERNDMVEYFGEQLAGYAISRFGWVQSYGSRCVKPPILYGDISRPAPMTVDWIRYAQSLTARPMKGMLTGPVTILNWSFVRDDQPRSACCLQLALAIREEVLDLERAGVSIIQIDEAALREGLPLRRADWHDYLDWAIQSFRIAANGVKDQTQIHTHMCYSEFNDIIEAIAAMDADVITIETSRSNMELLDAFDSFSYPNEIGPGVYDIHSPNIPSVPQIVDLMQKAAKRIPPARLWINPDCGLKTRRWEEVLPALHNMVNAARHLRETVGALPPASFPHVCP